MKRIIATLLSLALVLTTMVMPAVAENADADIIIVGAGGAGLSAAIAGNSDSYLNKSKFGDMDKTLASATKWIALVWAALTLALTLIH